MSPWRAAIDQALLLQKQPALVAAFRQTALPDGMPVLIRLASDEGGRRKDLAQLLDIDELQLQEAAIAYLRSVCLYHGSSDVRTLGLNAAVDLGVAKEHHRLLLKWLHPDRNPDNQALAERVNQAWSALKMSAKTGLAPAMASTSAPIDIPASPPSGRFPLFLWGLVAMVLVLWALSSLPDSDIYVADVGSESGNDVAGGSESAATIKDSTTEQRLKALKISFEDIKKSVLPATQPKPPAAKTVSVLASGTTIKPDKRMVDKKMQAKPSASPALASAEKAKTGASPDATLKSVQDSIQDQPESATAQSVGPALTEPVAARSALEPRRDLLSAGRALLAEFKERYRQGELDAFMQIFAATARNNRGDRQAIAADYGRLFGTSSSRKIGFSGEKWQVREGVIQFRANYSASVRRQGELLPVSSKGRIELILSEENGKLRIQQILLGE